MASSPIPPKPLSKYEFTARIHDIDAAGVLFFARNLYHAHDAYEAFLMHNNQSISTLLNSDFIFPISRTEADFKAPVFLNDHITIEIRLNEIKEDEFALDYHFTNQADILCSTTLTRHVCLDRSTHKRTNLPESIRSILV